MGVHRKIPTSREVWAMIKARHPELVVFGSYSAPEGDYYGNHDECRMMTEYGFKGCDYPIIGAKTTWDYNPLNTSERANEKHTYWLCVAEERDE